MENPRTSKELKKRILFLEQEREADKQRVKLYFKPLSKISGSGSMLQNLMQNTKVPTDLKTIAIKIVVNSITSFLVKRLTKKKEVVTETMLTDKVVEDAIERAVSRNTGKLSEQERKIFKKMLNQYLATH